MGKDGDDPLFESSEIIPMFPTLARKALVVTGCWATVLAPGTHHQANNHLSGAYHLRTPAAADTINFHDPRPQAGTIRPPVTALGAENTYQVVVRVLTGSLLLFPPGWSIRWPPIPAGRSASA